MAVVYRTRADVGDGVPEGRMGETAHPGGDMGLLGEQRIKCVRG